MTTRRVFVQGAVGVAVTAGLWTAAEAEDFAITQTEGEWRKRLTPDQFAVLRQSATERPFTSPLLEEHRSGTFTCAGCDQSVFSSDTKFDSGTGWPSF